MAGRKPRAPEVAEAAGAYTKHPGRRNPDAPRADGERPKPPKWLDKEALEKWHALLDLLEKNGLVSSDTLDILVAYCSSYSSWRKTQKMIDKQGMSYVDAKTGNLKRNPLLADLHKYRDQCNRLLPELGMTPSSRGRLVSKKRDEEDDPFKELLSRLGGGSPN